MQLVFACSCFCICLIFIAAIDSPLSLVMCSLCAPRRSNSSPNARLLVTSAATSTRTHQQPASHRASHHQQLPSMRQSLTSRLSTRRLDDSNNSSTLALRRFGTSAPQHRSTSAVGLAGGLMPTAIIYSHTQPHTHTHTRAHAIMLNSSICNFHTLHAVRVSFRFYHIDKLVSCRMLSSTCALTEVAFSDITVSIQFSFRLVCCVLFCVLLN